MPFESDFVTIFATFRQKYRQNQVVFHFYHGCKSVVINISPHSGLNLRVTSQIMLKIILMVFEFEINHKYPKLHFTTHTKKSFKK